MAFFHVPRRGNAAISLVAACGLWGVSLTEPAAEVQWVGETGFWDVGSNWASDPAVPDATDDVIINVDGTHTITVRSTGGPFTVNSVNMFGGDETLAISNGSLGIVGAITAGNPTGWSVISNYSLSGGTLGGSGDVRVSGLALLSGGTMTGTAPTTLQGGTTISSGISLDGVRWTPIAGQGSGPDTLGGEGVAGVLS